MHWYLKSLQQYADFKGRARRKEFWVASVIHLLILLVLGIIASVLVAMELILLSNIFYGLTALYALFCIIPSLSLGVRRLHDTGRSGWWMLLSFLPLVGIVLLIFLLLKGDKESNAYGANPMQVTA